jgi:hypothetical protein
MAVIIANRGFLSGQSSLQNIEKFGCPILGEAIVAAEFPYASVRSEQGDNNPIPVTVFILA